MGEFEELRAWLKGLFNSRKKELELAPIEKVMMNRLGVEKRKISGVAVHYYHSALRCKKEGRSGHFTIHIIHGKQKTRQMIWRNDFKDRMAENLAIIITEQFRGDSGEI